MSATMEIQTSLMFDEVSIVDSQGFATVSIEHVTERFRVAFCGGPTLNDKPLVPMSEGEQDDRSVLLLYPAGGRMDKPERFMRFFPEMDASAVRDRLCEAIAAQNAEVVDAAFSHPARRSCGMYPSHVMKAFTAMVLAHIKGMDEEYLEYVDYVLDNDEENEPGPLGERLQRWADKWVSVSNTPFRQWLNLNRFVEIGKIEGMPVYFSEYHQVYGYAGHPDAGHTIDIWLTAPKYPRGW
jgi:hypothetical protein